MKLLLAYASTDGHTRAIMRHIADRLCDQQHCVELLPLKEADDLDLSRFDRVIVAASVHVGRHQKELIQFVPAHREALKNLPDMLISVSLCAAGHDDEDWRALDKIVDDLAEATGWHPSRVEQVAGAYLPSRYDILTRFLMRRIIAKKDPHSDLDSDIVYTDWGALNLALDEWLAAP